MESQRTTIAGFFMRTFIASLIALYCAATASHASEVQKSPYDDIPITLQQGISTNTTLEMYVYNTLQTIRQNGTDRQYIDKTAFKRMQVFAQSSYRAQQVAQVLYADADQDGKVTREEVQQYILRNNRERDAQSQEKELNQFMRYDTDKNDIIEISEIPKSAGDDSAASRRETKLEELLALDPDKDGKLTASELETIARKTFAAIDTDKDGLISKEELEPLQKWRSTQSRRSTVSSRVSERMRTNCDLPSPDKSDKIVLLGISKGYGISSVALVDQDVETHATDIEIEKGNEPLYLVLASSGSMLWKLEGFTKRVSRVVLLTNSRTEKGTNPSGVSGIAGDKVSIMPPDSCFKTFGKEESIEAASAISLIREKLGREPDKVIAARQLKRTTLPTGNGAKEDDVPTTSLLLTTMDNGKNLVKADPGFSIQPAESGSFRVIAPGHAGAVRAASTPTVPEEFDAEVWRENVRYNPGGVIFVSPESVVAANEVRPYEVLPALAGISQLVGKGILKRIERGDYQIIKPLSRYPAELTGAYSVRFLLSKGIPEPEGDPGHSCVVAQGDIKLRNAGSCN